MKFNIAVLAGDGIGPEVVDAAIVTLNAVGEKFGHQFKYEYGLVGGIAIDEAGTPLPEKSMEICRRSDAVIFGAVGGPKWENPLAKMRPEDGILGVRKGLGLFANLRPVMVLPMLVNSTNLKPEVVTGVDFVVIRELTGGLYFGKPKKQWQTARGRRAVDTMAYTEKEISRILRVGFELARGRRKKLVSVDKANVLVSSRLWRQIAIEMAPEYPDVQLEHMYIDAASMRIIQNPRYFDVMVTENTFGDIITDEASMLAGSMGMLPSASIGDLPRLGKRIYGLYEPIHGSAPRHAGQDVANPIATILSVVMMLRYSFALETEANALDKAVIDVLNDGYRTYDIMSEGKTKVGTKRMAELIAQKVKR